MPPWPYFAAPFQLALLVSVFMHYLEKCGQNQSYMKIDRQDSLKTSISVVLCFHPFIGREVWQLDTGVAVSCSKFN